MGIKIFLLIRKIARTCLLFEKRANTFFFSSNMIFFIHTKSEKIRKNENVIIDRKTIKSNKKEE